MIKGSFCLQLDVHLVLVSLDKQRMPSLQKLYLCCSPQFSVEHLKEVSLLSIVLHELVDMRTISWHQAVMKTNGFPYFLLMVS